MVTTWRMAWPIRGPTVSVSVRVLSVSVSAPARSRSPPPARIDPARVAPVAMPAGAARGARPAWLACPWPRCQDARKAGRRAGRQAGAARARVNVRKPAPVAAGFEQNKARQAPKRASGQGKGAGN
jgi:hypothetical protein